MVFCEDALGAYIGVVYSQIMSAPLDGAWNISERFWQDPKWASDATSYVWDPNGKYLFVSTSGIYGEVGLYQLNLKSKKFKRLFPVEITPNTLREIVLIQIKSIDFKANKINIEIKNQELEPKTKIISY